MSAVLITIPFSHYCEKARWALDRAGIEYQEEGHLPIFSRRATRARGAGNTVPVLTVGEDLVADSTDIVAWIDQARPGTWLPRDPLQLSAALELEDRFDRELGPATRRWAYFYVLPQKQLLRNMTAQGVPLWQSRAFRLLRPLASAAIRRGLRIDAAGCERSLQKIDAVFAHVDALLADGREFLVGDSMSVADLTFAALAAPVLQPPEQPFGAPGPQAFTGEARHLIERWRDSPAGQFGLRMYAQHRHKWR